MIFGRSPKKQAAKGDEVRKFERIEFFQSSFYTENDATHECWFNNISLGGLCFDTHNADLDINEIIKILYKVGIKIRNDSCKICYKTRALNNWRYGCEFVEKDEQRDALIKKYVTEHVLNA